MILINGEKFVDFGWISEVIPVFPPRIISSKGSVRKAPISFVFFVLLSPVDPRAKCCLPHPSPIIAQAIANACTQYYSRNTDYYNEPAHSIDTHHTCRFPGGQTPRSQFDTFQTHWL